MQSHATPTMTRRQALKSITASAAVLIAGSSLARLGTGKNDPADPIPHEELIPANSVTKPFVLSF